MTVPAKTIKVTAVARYNYGSETVIRAKLNTTEKGVCYISISARQIKSAQGRIGMIGGDYLMLIAADGFGEFCRCADGSYAAYNIEDSVRVKAEEAEAARVAKEAEAARIAAKTKAEAVNALFDPAYPMWAEVTIQRPNGDIETLNYTKGSGGRIRFLSKSDVEKRINPAMAQAKRGKVIAFVNHNESPEAELTADELAELEADAEYRRGYKAITKAMTLGE